MRLFSQPNFKVVTEVVNGQPFKLRELSAEGMLNHTEYQASCAEDMKAVMDQMPANTEDWTDSQTNKVNIALTVFKVRSRVRLVALALQPSFIEDPDHPLHGLPLEDIEQALVQEMKAEQIKQLEDAVLAMSGLPSLDDPTPKPDPDATSPTS